MSRAVVILLLGLLIISGSGCATVATGKYQEIPITSEPPGAKVRSDTGLSIVTPGKMLLERNKTHILVAEYPGCEPQQAELKNKVQGWFWGNILLGGIIGGIVDIASGACDELQPKKINFNFTPIGQVVANRKQSYLTSHPETSDNIRFTILNELAVKGMTKEELLASLGPPNKIEETGKYKKYIYENREPKNYYLKNDVLEKAE